MTSPNCCGKSAEWIVQSVRLAYWYCRECKNEVVEVESMQYAINRIAAIISLPAHHFDANGVCFYCLSSIGTSSACSHQSQQSQTPAVPQTPTARKVSVASITHDFALYDPSHGEWSCVHCNVITKKINVSMLQGRPCR